MRTIFYLAFSTTIFLCACGDDSSSSGNYENFSSDSQEESASKENVEACKIKYNITEETPWVQDLSDSSQAENYICTRTAYLIDTYFGKFALCNSTSYDKDNNLLNMTLTTEFSEVHVKASLTGCRFTLTTEGTFSRLSEIQEQYIDNCLCKEENGSVFYRKIVPVKLFSSSSSEISSSSSSSSDRPACSSSSVRIIKPSEVKSGSITDKRDGREYKTVTIGNQTWMAENLAYAYLQETDKLDSSSFCVDNEPENCEKYGRLYLWSAAMDSVGLFSDDGKGCGYSSETCSIKYNTQVNVRGVCPEGWEIPSVEDFENLFLYIGGTKELQYPEWNHVAEKLKSDSLWDDYKGKSGNGSNDYGFNILPVGRAVFFGNDSTSLYFGTVHSYDLFDVSYFWTTHHYNAFAAIEVTFESYSETADIAGGGKEGFNPIRCIKK